MRRPRGVEPISSEQELQTKLQRPRSMRSGGMQEAGAGKILVDVSTGAAPTPLRVVEDVESLCPKFKSHRFSNLKELKERHVKIRAPRHMKNVATRIAERKAAGRCKCAGV